MADFQNSVTQLTNGSSPDGWKHGVFTVLKEWLVRIYGSEATVNPQAPQQDTYDKPYIYYYLLPSTSRSKGAGSGGQKVIVISIAIEVYVYNQQTPDNPYVRESGLQQMGDKLWNGYEEHYGALGNAGLRKPKFLMFGSPVPDEKAYIERHILTCEVTR